jgi:hypothetical protein
MGKNGLRLIINFERKGTAHISEIDYDQTMASCDVCIINIGVILVKCLSEKYLNTSIIPSIKSSTNIKYNTKTISIIG